MNTYDAISNNFKLSHFIFLIATLLHIISTYIIGFIGLSLWI